MTINLVLGTAGGAASWARGTDGSAAILRLWRLLFRLDAHYSGGITAHGDQVTPVFDEIRHILNHPVKAPVIVIDDARLFDGTDGYPTFRGLHDFAGAIDRGCMV